MTYRDSDGWYLPSRIPQHAAPFGFARPLRHRAHLAIRLFVTAGSWAAGLCLIIGLVVFVSNATAADKGKHAGASSQGANQLRSGDPTTHFPQAQSGPLQPLPYTFSGHATTTSATFAIPGGHRLMIRWSYQCQASDSSTQFTILDVLLRGGQPRPGPAFIGSGISGEGTIALPRGSRTHYLLISSTCTWRIKVRS
jgi:hypothetical protein